MFVILATALLSTGAALLGMSIKAIILGALSRSWPAVAGEITTVKTFTKFDANDNRVWRQELEYSYSVGGTAFRGTRFRFGVPSRISWRAESERPFEMGQIVDVYYRAAQPATSALRRGWSPFAYIVFATGFGLAWMGMVLLMG